MKTKPHSQPPAIQLVCCPNCGKEAQRSYLHYQQLIETSCPNCDYFLLNSLTGQVLESYAPGIAGKMF